MNQVEERLQAAGEETRRLAQTRIPAGATTARPGPARGWLVLVTAFAVVVLTFGVIPWLVSTGERTPIANQNVTSNQPATTSVATTEASCSSTGVAEPSAQPELPAAVSATRQAMIDAALSCDFDTLRTLAADQFTASFGGRGFDYVVERDRGEGGGGLGDLLRLFDVSYGRRELANGTSTYVWPKAFTYETWEEVPDAHLDELRAIHTDDELSRFAEFGVYTGWRIGIDENGFWLYYVAGD